MVARRTRAAVKAGEGAAEAEAVPPGAASSEGEDADSDGGDGHEAPEEVTFESARATAQEARRLAGERARR